MVLLSLCGILAIGKFAISDFWGGISMILVCMMGAFVLTGEHGLNVTNCLFFAVMAFISAIFDVMACVMYLTHSKYALFDSKAPTMVLVAQSVFVASPIVLTIAGCVAYSMYSDCRSNMAESAPFGGGYDDGYGYGSQPPPRQPQAGPPRGPPREPQNQPFQGQGQRLGGGNSNSQGQGQRLGDDRQ